MSMLDVHADAIKTVNEAHHTFLLKYRKDEKKVFGFVEGKDDPMFYRSVIERFLPEDWSVELIQAGNRVQVIKTHSAIDWHIFSASRIVFFIDADLHAMQGLESFNPSNVYITDQYSIENDVACVDVFKRLLSEACNIIDALDEEMENICNSYLENLSYFKMALRPIMIQAALWKSDHIDPKFDKLSMGSLGSFDTGKFVLHSNFLDENARIDHVCEKLNLERSKNEKFEAMASTFDAAQGGKKYIRGKYILWHFSNFLINVHKNITEFVSAYEKPPKMKIAFGLDNVMTLAAPRARSPVSLRLFIERTYLSYVKNFSS